MNVDFKMVNVVVSALTLKDLTTVPVLRAIPLVMINEYVSVRLWIYIYIYTCTCKIRQPFCIRPCRILENFGF